MKLFSAQRFGIKLLMVFLLLAGVSTAFAAGELDTSFNASAYGALNGPVLVFKKQPDGKILVGGFFLDINGVAAGGLGRLNADLTVDSTFNPPDFGNGAGVGGTIFAIGVQSDGKIIVGGDFYGVDYVFNPGLKRLFPNGTLDTGFQPPQVPQGFVYHDLEILPDDKILAGGQRLNPDGTVDSSFAAIISGVKEMEVQPDGKILAATAGPSSFRRYNSDGTLDNSFAVVNTDGTINTIMHLPDGKTLIGGTFSSVNSFQQGRIARISADGTLDLTFNQNMIGFNGTVNKIILRTDGKLMVGGIFGSYNGVASPRLVLLNTDGSRDVSFQSALSNIGNFLNDFEILPNGKIIAGFDSNVALNTIYVFNPDGSFDNSTRLVATRSSSVNRITRQPDGKILMVGNFQYANGEIRRSIARLNLNGSLDTSFVPYFTGVNSLAAVAVQPDGRILVGGVQTPVLARLNPDGSQDTSFTPNSIGSAAIRDIAVLPDGKILITGDGGSVFRLNDNGTTDVSFTIPVFNNIIYRLAVQPDGKIVVGGSFTSIGSTLRGRIARLNTNGTLDTSFNPPGGANGTVYNLDLQADGKVVLVGDFTGLNGSTNQNRVGRLNADGTLDTSFVLNSTVNATVFAVKVQADGKIIVGGSFNQVGSTSRPGLARFNANGTLDTAFNPFVNITTPGVTEIYLQTDGKILVGGQFTKMNGVSHVRIARLINNTAPARAPFDYDGDGKADISVFRPSENKWYILQSSNSAILQVTFAVAGDVPAPSDYDGDGKTDVAVFRPSSGDWWYLSSINNAQVNVHWGQSGDIPRPSDFDGDGKTDFVVYRPSNSVWYRLSATGQSSALAFGIAEDKPLVGDFDGDGKSDLAIFRPSTGDWWYAGSVSGQFSVVHWGQAGDIPVPGDYDADGKTDFVVYRPSNGGWYILRSGEQNYTILQFGAPEDKPVAADYDGDGKADVAVWRPSTGTWYLLQTTAGFGAVQWGAAGDIPTENAFVP